ncbi:MAG: chloride channel protein [Terriglobia bacterium]
MPAMPTPNSRHRRGARHPFGFLFSNEFGKAIKPRIALLSIYSLGVGLVAGLVAEGVLELIYLFTNVFFAGRWSFKVVYPDDFHLGLWVILIPAIGGIVAGLVIHYWEPTLKGHGTPEAMEAVLIGHSVLRLRVGILKPIVSALAIGTGGPFGAEGPIIQTGGVIGSFFGQLLHLSPYERRILLAGGAAAGLAATFLSPFAGVLLAVELLLFEFSARSFIPVAMATVVATAVAILFRGSGALFPAHAWALKHMGELWLFALLGLLIGIISVILIRVLFWIENIFDRFPLKPATVWAPTVGALIMGCIGYFFPHVFGTGYDTITAMLNNHFSTAKLLEISGAKFWALVISLGSGTSGGVFAPSLIIGGGFGAAFGAFWHHLLPQFTSNPAAYALAGMGALFAGTSRVPITAVVFMIELSRNPHAVLPLIVTCFIADLFTRLFSVDSIMTGKLHKRGLMVFQDYSTPVLVGSQIGQVVRRQKPVPADLELDVAARLFSPEPGEVLAVVETDGKLAGIIEAHDLLYQDESRRLKVRDVTRADYVVAHPEELVPAVAQKMLARHANNVIVEEQNRPVGVVRAFDLLRLQRGLQEKHLLTSLKPLLPPNESQGEKP